MSEYFCVFTYQWWNYPPCLTLSLSQRDKDAVWTSLPTKSPRRCQSKFTETWLTITLSLTQDLPLFLSFPSSVLSHSWRPPLSHVYFLSPSPSLSLSPFLLSPDIKPWLLCKRLSFPILFIVSCSKTLPVFLPFTTLWTVGLFPLYVLLLRMGILPFFWYCSPNPKQASVRQLQA